MTKITSMVKYNKDKGRFEPSDYSIAGATGLVVDEVVVPSPVATESAPVVIAAKKRGRPRKTK